MSNAPIEGDSGAGDDTGNTNPNIEQTSTITTTYKGVTKTWYTKRVNSHYGSVNTATLYRQEDGTFQILLVSKPTVENEPPSSDTFSFALQLPTITTGTFSTGSLMQYDVNGVQANNAFQTSDVTFTPYDAVFTTAEDDGTDVHLIGTITDFPITSLDTGETDNITVEFDITAS